MRRTLGYNPALDGLRALAVSGVVVQHAGFEEGGYFGVTVFFVISGYLITGLLLAEHDSTGRIDLGAFYRRRFARLGPALLLVSAVVLGWLLSIRAPLTTWWAGLLGTLTYTTDLLLATPVAAHVGSYYEWSWSLGIEEQFYLVWPLLMILLLRRRAGHLALVLASAAAIVLGWLDRAALSRGHPSHARVNFAFDTHMDAIAFGALIALAVAGNSFGLWARTIAQLSCLAGAVGLFVVILQPWQTLDLTTLDAGGYGQVAVLCAAIVAGVVIAPRGPLSWVLSRAVLVHLGKLSYGLYLWNLLLAEGYQHILGSTPARSGPC
jgi:peptidoglycan/LPS O-acetylase OafA/YrhL